MAVDETLEDLMDELFFLGRTTKRVSILISKGLYTRKYRIQLTAKTAVSHEILITCVKEAIKTIRNNRAPVGKLRKKQMYFIEPKKDSDGHTDYTNE